MNYRRNLIDDNQNKDKNRDKLTLIRRVINIHGIPKKEKLLLKREIVLNI